MLPTNTAENTGNSQSETPYYLLESEFPSLPTRKAWKFDTNVSDQNLKHPHSDWQRKYTQKQSVGESNGIQQKLRSLEVKKQNKRKRKNVYKKPLIKNQSNSMYTPKQSKEFDLSSYPNIFNDETDRMNRFSLLLNESDLTDNDEYEENGVSDVAVDPNSQTRENKKRKRSHQKKYAKNKAKKYSKRNNASNDKFHAEEDFFANNVVADKPFQISIDISTVSSDLGKNIVYTDNIEEIPMSAIYNFVSEKTGVSSRNLYFRKISGQYIDKKSWITREIQNIVMFFKLDGGVRGRKRKGDSHHPGKECGPCVVCGKSENRYFHLIDRQDQESLQQYFHDLHPGINVTDCVCRICESGFKNKNYMSVKRSKTEPTKSTQPLCDLSAYGICEMQKERSVLVNKKELFDTFKIPINCSGDTNITVNLCSHHRLKFFNRSCRQKCLICLKFFLSADKKYFFTESVLEFARLYVQNVPCTDADADRYLSSNGPVCRGCKYSVEKYMTDNFKSEGGNVNYDLHIQNVKVLWSGLTESNPGLSNCICTCCDAFIEHKPVLLAELHQNFLKTASDDEKVNLNQRWLLQKILEIFQMAITVTTDGYKRMGTMLKRSDNDDNKSLHSLIYNSFTSNETEIPDTELPKHDIIINASKCLRDNLVGMKEKLSSNPIDIENFDPWKFIEESCDPLLFNFISSLQGETMPSIIDKLDIGMLKKNKALACLNILNCLLFSSDLSCSLPLPMLISDIIDKYTNSSSECLRILNQFGICYSKPSLNRYQNSVIERKNEIGAQISLESFTVCSVDNINKRSSYASVKASDTSRGFDGTSVQLVEPKPISCKWSNEEVNQELAGCISLIDTEGIKYKKLKVKSDLSLFRCISAICSSHIRFGKRNESGTLECSEIEAEDDKICSILSDYVSKLLQSTDGCQVEKSEHNLYYAISYLTNIPIQVFQKCEGQPGKIELVFQSSYLQMGRISSSFVLNILKETTDETTCNYSPIFTSRTYFNENLLPSDFFTSVEQVDIETEKVAFKLFFMTASSCSANSTSKTTGKMRNSILQEDIATEFSNLNLNLNARRNILSNDSAETTLNFETTFMETSDESSASSKLSKKAFSYCVQKHLVEKHLSECVHPNFLQYLELESVSMTEKSTVKFLYVLDENADNRETIKLTLDKLYGNLGIQKALNYLVVVGDAKTYDHLVQLKNDYPEELKWLLPFIGDWHALKNYQLMLMKIYLDVGLREMVHLFHQGILARVVSEATGFDKTHTFLLQCWEAMYRFELQMFFLNQTNNSLDDMDFSIENGCSIISDYLKSASSREINYEHVIGLMNQFNENLAGLEVEFKNFYNRVCAENKTWQLWHNFIHVDCFIYIQFYLSLRTGDWNLRNLCIKHISKIAQVTDSRFYSRLLPQNLTDIHRFPRCVIEHFENGGFVMNILGRKNHSQGLDEGHESCINKDVKAVLNNCSDRSLSKAVTYAPTRANSLRKIKESIGITKHDALVFSPSEATSHEENVIALKDSLGKSYLFAIYLNPSVSGESDSVHHLFSSKSAEHSQSEKLLNLKDIGTEHLKIYVKKNQKLNNYALCKQKPLKLTGVFGNKVSVSTVKRELRDVQSQNKMFRIQIDWCAKNNIVMDDMKQYLNSPLPRAISTIDGLPYKTDNKSSILGLYKSRYPDCFESFNDFSSFDTVVLDAMFMIRSKPLGSFKTFSEYVLYLYTKHVDVHFRNGVQTVHVVFDDQNDSVLNPKSIERSRRDIAADERPILSSGNLSLSDPLPRPLTGKKWDKFLSLRENKRKLVHLISEQFLVIGCNLLQSDQNLYIGGGFCESFITKQVNGSTGSVEPCPQMYCNAMEGDSRVWFHAFTCKGLKCLVHSPDNDTYHVGLPLIDKYPEKVIFMALDEKFETLMNLNLFSHLIKYDTSFVSSVPNVLSAIQMLYVSTGCDYVSFFKNHSKRSFFGTFVKKVDFISSGPNLKGSLSDFDSDPELGFLSFLRLVGCEYFSKSEFEFKDMCKNMMTPENVFRYIAKDHKTDLENHTYFIQAIRDALFKRCAEEQNLPTVDALRLHWLRSCWVCKVYAQADKKSTVYPSLTEFGWVFQDNKLKIVWDTPENIQAIESKIKLWTEGCGCKTGCTTNRCKCKSKDVSCSPGCKCGSSCKNVSVNTAVQPNSLLHSAEGQSTSEDEHNYDSDENESSDTDEMFPDN